MFHIGLLNILKRAKDQCDFLIGSVTSDELCMLRKNKYSIIPENDRMSIVEAIQFVDKVLSQANMVKLNAVKATSADVVFVGSDWNGTESWNKYEK